MRKQQNLINIEVGARLLKWRNKKGYNQGQLASGMGLTRTSVVNIERGRQSLTIEGLLKAASILKCKPSDLLPPTPKAVTKELKKVKKVIHEKLLDVNFKW